MDEFSKRLRLLRKGNSLGIKSLAKELGISYTYISHIERGKAKPSEELIRKLAVYFHVDQEELLLSVGKFPPDVEKILYEHPREVDNALARIFQRLR